MPYACCRFYSSEGDGNNASRGKHVPVKSATSFDKEKVSKEESISVSRRHAEHAWLGEQDQLDWLSCEKMSIDSQIKESLFLTKRQRFKNEFMRRVVPWEKIKVSWDKFPYHIREHTKNLLVECAASHLRHKKFALSYGARLISSTGRILLQGFPGTELLRERMVRALARDLQVPLLVLDSNILTPYDFGQEFASERETDDSHVESGEECTSESDAEDENAESNDEWTSSNENRSSESDSDDIPASVETFEKLEPRSLEEFAKRVAGEVESASTSKDSGAATPPEQSKRPLSKGDRVKYVGASVQVNCGSLSTGKRGEVYEINGDQVAVIFDNAESKVEELNVYVAKEEDAKPSIYWINIQDLVHDLDAQAADWYIAMESLCEILPSLQPIILYFPDCSPWLSRAVPKSNRKEFIKKVEEMLQVIPGPVVFICGQNIMESGFKEKENLPLTLKRVAEGLGVSKSLNEKDIYRLFTNTLYIHPPEEDEQLRIFNKKIEEDRRIIISRNNLIELHKVLGEHQLSCTYLLHVKTDGVFLTKQKAEKVIGWAKSHYLSSSLLPTVKGDRLMIPSGSLDIAIARLKDEESILKKNSESLVTITKDEFEKNFVSALIPPDEIGVRFDDVGALEDVKRTLNELVSLPMRRPELFSHGNLLRPCKGVLLFGPPGTGKTLLAKALATEAGANFINITSSSLTSKWFGDAEKLTKALFSFASRLTPVIIFIDEVDSLLGARGGTFEHEATRRIRNEFMAAWDGLKTKDSQRILVLAATNRPFDLDDAVIRRLPRRIYIGLPDADNRTKILKVLLARENLEPDFRFDKLAIATDGYSGSDLKNLCIAAAYRPVEELLEAEKERGQSVVMPSLRLLQLDDFIKAKSKVGASIAYDATSMNELRQWNDQYGEGGSRARSPFGFGNSGR
ncbi:spastin-like isoform X2 [Zingiber officinale]|nr:spastin-like isoform X2 [Zingiber officinale]XP_042391033.1 spastin-like isoform X2 [Zingiber officinale]XP_042391034.1 spastin-like isoform X2 [Zingiber officinale]XP_042391035.1 spastin-like isoform X2 [Zingiber officinale]